MIRKMVLSLAGISLAIGISYGQAGLRWSAERNILPPNYGASEARVVILSDGSINVTFRGSLQEEAALGGIYFTRSTNQGYSWDRPVPAVSLSGILPVSHELITDGDNLMAFVAIDRLARFEVQQFLSSTRGSTWRPSEIVFSEVDIIKGISAWRLQDQLCLMVLTERRRPGGDSEFTFWLVKGRSSGAYWEVPVKVANFFAASATNLRKVEAGTSWPSIYWRQNNLEDHILEAVSPDGLTWRDRRITNPPPLADSTLQLNGIYYRVRTDASRLLLFNRTDDEIPVGRFITNIPRDLDKSTLKVSWTGKDNYTLPKDLKYELSLNEEAPILVKDATTYEFNGLLNGSHRLSLVAIDEAMNRQTPPAVESFTVRVLPIAKFTTPTNGEALNTSTVRVSWDAQHNCKPNSQVSFSLKVDDQEWTEFAPEKEKMVADLEDGEHVFFIKAKDDLGNISEPGQVRFEVDTTPPTCTVEELPRNWVADVDWNSNPEYKVEFKVSGSDNRTPNDQLFYRSKILGARGDYSEWRSVNDITSFSALEDGIHQIAFQVRDEVQNFQLEPTIVEVSYNTPPNTRIWLDDTTSEKVVRFAGKDDNSRVTDISYSWRIDEGAWSEWTIETRWPVAILMKDVPHGEHTVYVKARDKAGNEDPTPASLVLEVDRTPPPVPTNVVITPRDDGAEVEIRWDAVQEPGVVYHVYRSDSELFVRESAVPIDVETQRTRTADRPTLAGTTKTYYYFVTAVDSSGNESAPSAAQSVQVLGEVERRENRFREYRTNIDNALRGNQWDRALQLAKDIPPELVESSERQPFQSYWINIAQAGKALNDPNSDMAALVEVRRSLESFIDRYASFSETDRARDQFNEVKSRILWLRLKSFSIYGVILLVILGIFAFVYRMFTRNRGVTEMPLIKVVEGTETIQPSKEALKDPTVLRRWAEVQSSPESAENWSRLAFAFHNIGELENAIQSLYKALEIDPNHTRFHFQMGHFQREAKNLKEAIKHFERYLQLNPESKKSAEEVKELLTKLKQESGTS